MCEHFTHFSEDDWYLRKQSARSTRLDMDTRYNVVEAAHEVRAGVVTGSKDEARALQVVVGAKLDCRIRIDCEGQGGGDESSDNVEGEHIRLC